jgi:hypothetical protein
MLSVDVEGWKNHVVGYGSAAAVGPLAWRVRDFNCSFITDGRAGLRQLRFRKQAFISR